MRLYVVGAGTPIPTPSRFGSSYVLQVEGDHLLFDCGPATTYKLVRMGVLPTQIDYLFFTHHHFDHDVDYPCFLLTRWDQGASRERQLSVWGPEPTAWITDRLIAEDGAFSHDWKARVAHPGSQAVFVNRGGTLPRPAPAVEVTDIAPGAVIERESWRVTAAEAYHTQPWIESLAYRVDTSDGSIVFSGDAGPSAELRQLAQDADTLVVHCWDHQDRLEASGEGLGEMGTIAAGQTAAACGAKRLIVSHSTPNLTLPGSRERGIADIARSFGGEVIFAEELMTLAL